MKTIFFVSLVATGIASAAPKSFLLDMMVSPSGVRLNLFANPSSVTKSACEAAVLEVAKLFEKSKSVVKTLESSETHLTLGNPSDRMIRVISPRAGVPSRKMREGLEIRFPLKDFLHMQNTRVGFGKELSTLIRDVMKENVNSEDLKDGSVSYVSQHLLCWDQLENNENSNPSCSLTCDSATQPGVKFGTVEVSRLVERN